MGEAVAGRFYVRRRTRPDGSFDFWCVNRLFNDPPKSEAAVVFQHVCEMGLEGIVSAAWLARRSGRSTDWLTFKNPKALVVKPEGEEEWGTEKWR